VIDSDDEPAAQPFYGLTLAPTPALTARGQGRAGTVRPFADTHRWAELAVLLQFSTP
jgi:hypothetical protein